MIKNHSQSFPYPGWEAMGRCFLYTSKQRHSNANFFRDPQPKGCNGNIVEPVDARMWLQEVCENKTMHSAEVCWIVLSQVRKERAIDVNYSKLKTFNNGEIQRFQSKCCMCFI